MAPKSDPSPPNEQTHLLLTKSSTSTTPTQPQTKHHAHSILLTTTISRLGSRTWEFATPLLLLEWSPGSLAAPAALGLICSLFRTVVSPMLGTLADEKWDRMKSVVVGTVMQGGGCLLSVGALIVWNVFWERGVIGRIVSFCIVIIAGVVEALGAQLASVAVKKEWVPIVFDESVYVREESGGVNLNDAREEEKKGLLDMFLPKVITLSFMNTTMTNIDLLAAMFGPVLAGWILEVLIDENGSVQRGFAVIALLNVISFVPEIFLLRRVYLSCPALQRKQVVSNTNNANESFGSATEQNPWTIWFNHPSGLPLLTISMASLYVTALSPAGILLTAYLVTIGVSPTAIGIFRGIGSLSGVLGIALFSAFRGGNDDQDSDLGDEASRILSARSIERLRRVSLAFLLLEVISVLVAAAAFYLNDASYHSDTPASLSSTNPLSWQIIVFLVAIVISRAGLWSFDVGVLEIEQLIVDERYRNAVGSVEGALCSLAEMGKYVLSIALPNPADFGWQVGISASAVSFGGATFALFLCLYHMHGHCHGDHMAEGHCHDHDHDHVHRHTLQQERELKNGYHIHLHRQSPCQKLVDASHG